MWTNSTQLGRSKDPAILAVKKLELPTKIHRRQINVSPIDIEDEVASSDSDASVIGQPAGYDDDTEIDSEGKYLYFNLFFLTRRWVQVIFATFTFLLRRIQQ